MRFLALLLMLPFLASAQPFTLQDIAFIGGRGPLVTDWSTRVVANGGAVPSQNSIIAVEGCRQCLINNGLDTNMIALNVIAPDSLIAMQTPLIVGTGFPLWTNVLFGLSNLTVNGLSGNGVDKYLKTGLNPSVIFTGANTNSSGIAVLMYNNSGSSLSSHALSGLGTSGNTYFLEQTFGDQLYFYCWRSVTVNTDFLTRVLPQGSAWAGWWSGYRTAPNAIRLDWVTNGVHNVATNGTGNTTVGPLATNMFFMANAPPGDVPAQFSDQTISFVALTKGLTQAQSSNLWICASNTRAGFGGGIPDLNVSSQLTARFLTNLASTANVSPYVTPTFTPSSNALVIASIASGVGDVLTVINTGTSNLTWWPVVSLAVAGVGQDSIWVTQVPAGTAPFAMAVTVAVSSVPNGCDIQITEITSANNTALWGTNAIVKSGSLATGNATTRIASFSSLTIKSNVCVMTQCTHASNGSPVIEGPANFEWFLPSGTGHASPNTAINTYFKTNATAFTNTWFANPSGLNCHAVFIEVKP